MKRCMACLLVTLAPLLAQGQSQTGGLPALREEVLAEKAARIDADTALLTQINLQNVTTRSATSDECQYGGTALLKKSGAVLLGLVCNGAPGGKGDQGIQGVQGTQGEQGPMGPPGPIGPRGDTGLQGPSGSGGITWFDLQGSNRVAAPKEGYLAGAASPSVIDLPPSGTFGIGSSFRVVGSGGGGWKITASTGNILFFGPNTGVGSLVTRDTAVPGDIWSTRGHNRDWQAVAVSPDGRLVIASGGAVHAIETYPVCAGAGMFVSHDFGLTWAQSLRDNGGYGCFTARYFVVSADGTKLIGQNAIERKVSIDGGLHWSDLLSVGYYGTNHNGPLAASSDLTIVYSGSGVGVAVSRDGGVTWPDSLPANAYGHSISAIAASADGSRVIAASVDYAGSTAVGGPLIVSSDFGLTWTVQAAIASSPVTSIATSADGSRWIAGTDGGQLYTSSDSGATWTARESPRAWTSVSSSTDGMKLAAVAKNDRLYTSVDGGASWIPREAVKPWNGVATSADGSRITAVTGCIAQTTGSVVNNCVYEGQVYTSVPGGLQGGLGTSVELQYIGNDTYLVVSATGPVVGF